MGIVAINTISVVNAVDITIDPNTAGGIKEAVNSAKDGDTIILKDGVYKGKANTNIVISKSITIKGFGSNAILDGQEENQIFKNSGEKVSLEKLKFRNGYSRYGGAIRQLNGSLTLNHCTFTNNQAIDYTITNPLKGEGGAIYIIKGNSTLKGCIFKNNQAEFSGGAVYSSKKVNLTVIRCTFKNNQVIFLTGGAIESEGSLTVISSTFINNRADDGGAIYSLKGNLNVISSIFFNNKACYNEFGLGGAICTFTKSIVDRCTFKNNQAKNAGGAIYSGVKNSLTVINSIFINNRADDGGAIYSDNTSTLTVGNSKFKNNKAYTGGAITSEDISIISNCTFKSNQAKKMGGAIYNLESMKIINSKFKNNIAGKVYNALFNGGKITKRNIKVTPKYGTKVKK